MDRSQQLLRHLATTEGWCTSAELASTLGCSVRTVKTEVSRLNAEHPGIVTTGRKGFSLGDRELLARIAPAAANPVPQTAEERRSLILRKLLMGRREISMEQLADELCVSDVTLTKDLARVRLDMAEYGLEVRSKGGVLHVEGDEANEKRMVSQQIFDETKGFFSQMELMAGYFPNLAMQELHDEVEDILMRRRLFLNDYALSNFILHLAIVLERSLGGFAPATDEGAARLERSVVDFVDEVCGWAEGRYGTQVPAADRTSLAIIASTRLEPRGSDGADYVGEEALDVVRDLIGRVRDQYAIELGGEDFLIRFGLHVKNMLVRLDCQQPLRNPQTASIRNDYPFVYDVAVFIAQAIRASHGVTLPDDEIAYIALHIGCLIEEQNVERSKVRCVLVSPSYNTNAVALAWRILRAFESSMLIDGVVDDVSRLPQDYQPDLLVTTMPLLATPPYPVVEISPFLGERDLASLRAHLEMVRALRRRQKMERRLRTFLSRELFFCGEGWTARDEALEAMGGALVRQGFVRDDFVERLREREAISSSAYLDVALPHPLDMDALHTAIAVSVHPNGLDWEGTTVHLVLMLAIQPDDRPVFRNIFDFVTEALYDPRHMAQVCAATSFEEFLDALLASA